MTLIDQIVVSIIASSVTAGLAYLGFWRKAKVELQKEFQNKFNDRKWELYLKNIKYINLLRDVTYLTFPKLENKDHDKYVALSTEMKDLESQIEFEIMLVGSKQVVESYMKWKKSLIDGVYDNSDTFELMIESINSMREDLGLEKALLSNKSFDSYFYVSEESRLAREKEH